MNDLEKTVHPKAVFLIKPDTKAIIYPDGPLWVLSIGCTYKTGDWRKPLGTFQNVDQAINAAKGLGFVRVSVRHIYRPKTWSTRYLTDEKTWRQRYIDNRAQGPIPPHRRGIRYGLRS